MKIKSQGFAMKNLNSNVQVREIVDYFIQQSMHELKRKDYNRQILLKEDGNYYTGLVLTFKNHKKNCLSEIKNGVFKVKVEDLKTDDKLVSFNFFCINKTSFKGLYLYYRGSCSLNSLFSQWQSYSNYLFRKKCREEIKSLGKNPEQAKLDEVNSKYEQRVEFSILIDHNDLLSILNGFNEIKSAAFKFDSVEFKESEMMGVEQFTRNTEVIFNISDNNKNKVQQVAGELKQVFDNIAGITKGIVRAVDHHKNERIIDLLNSPSFFSEYDFDELAAHVDGLNNENYSSNPIIDIIKDEMSNGVKRNEFI